MTVSTGHCAWAIRQSETTEPSIRISLFLRSEGIRPFLSLRISRIILDLDCCKIYFIYPKPDPKTVLTFVPTTKPDELRLIETQSPGKPCLERHSEQYVACHR